VRTYLAGKIAKGGWRSRLVEWHPDYTAPKWWGTYSGWPELTISPGLTCVGPYAISDDHGCFHGNETHGVGAAMWDMGGHGYLVCGGSYDGVPRHVVHAWCLDAIKRCDVIFAWLDDLTAHGTLIELGYAKALGKPIFIGFPDHLTFHELWFARHLTTWIVVGEFDEAWGAFSVMASTFNGKRLLAQCESPIEKAFWREAVLLGLNRHGLRPAHSVRTTAGRLYRIDFAIPEHKFGIELDGYEFHSNRDQFDKDRRRQRELELDGWRIVRFSGREVHNDARSCAVEAQRIIHKEVTG